MAQHEEHTEHSQGFYILIGLRPARPDVNHRRRRVREPRPFNPVVALLIATIKATLVVLFFMHVKGASEKADRRRRRLRLLLSCDSAITVSRGLPDEILALISDLSS